MKGTFITLGAIFVFFICFAVYFAGQVSAVYPPLKSYNYPMSVTEIKERLTQIAGQEHSMTFTITDITGAPPDQYYYARVSITNDHRYDFHIRYNRSSSFWDKTIKSEILLIGAFDTVRGTGGYKKDDADVPKLIEIFELELTGKLKNSEPADQGLKRFNVGESTLNPEL